VTGGVFERHHGGKGGNQAVAAARALGGGSLDGAVRLVGAVEAGGTFVLNPAPASAEAASLLRWRTL
jgi:hypothetical protein